MSTLINWKKAIPLASLRRGNNPFTELQHEVDKAMNDFYHAFEAGPCTHNIHENLTISPAIDIVDEKDSFKVEVEMPGIAEDDIKVSIDSNVLTIKGEKHKSTKNRDKNYTMREISYGYYERSITLPDTVDPTRATASFKKGMLWVTFPKRPETQARRQELKVEKVTN